ncbi:hypothetical protein BGZ73_004055 [Actinomortierella ambigua]|nr:hypothetical protein BGZ73_004055 [Actinomortierella ambigua]
MVRHEKNIGLLLVAWGYDATLAGYYLSVTDRRLAWREEQSTEVEDIVYKVSSDGTGHFFDLHTYVSGGGGGGGGRFGYKVSDDTIFTFMRRYGIDPAKIFSEDAIGSDDDIKTCANARCSSLKDVKATEALIREGRLLGLKAFAIATALCLSGSAIIVGATRWALDVQTIPEFSAKMRDLFPKQRAKFVEAVVDADQAVFGGNKKQEDQNRQEHGTESSQDEEVDLDHEQDSNLLSRIERDLTKLAEEDP